MNYLKIGVKSLLLCAVAVQVTVGSITLSNAAERQEEKEHFIFHAGKEEVLIYEDASCAGNPIAYLPMNASGYLKEETEHESWYVTSGEIQGYIKENQLLKGQEAWEMADKKLDKKVVITSDTVFVYEDEERKGRVSDLLSSGDEVDILSEKENVLEVVTSHQMEGFIASTDANVSPLFIYAEEITVEDSDITSKYSETYTSEEEYNDLQGAESDTITGEDVVSYALQFVGNPYVWGGDSLLYGTDCSGFVKGVYAKFGVTLPRTSEEQRNSGNLVCEGWNEKKAQPGDLVGYEGHIAIYIGDGKIVHAANETQGIIVSDADYREVLCVRRILGCQTAWSITNQEKEILCRIVEAEAGGEGFKGKVLVANVILNRVASNQFPDTVEAVVFQNSGGTYQFSPVKDGRYHSVTISEETKQAVNKALEGMNLAQGALYFMNPDQADSNNVRWFQSSLRYLFQYGSHSFYK